MTQHEIPASFVPGAGTTGSAGQRAHPEAFAQTSRLARKVYRVGEKAWCLVGNGLSNQTFVEGPEGLIVIDTGECVEEMQLALAAIREVTDAPVAACIYSHFHYVNGTRALMAEVESLPIYGHAGIAANLRRFGGEAGPRYARGLVYQFGVMLPADGPDALENVGLGRFLRNPEHAPYTPGYLPVTHGFEDEHATRVAGLDVVMTPAPSDATDSITIHFPALNLAVNNLVWPALFNVFAIRGEEYRDPRIVIDGLDHLGRLGCEHLIGTHGPPVSNAEEVLAVITDYRDAIQYLWDQTVRGANKGLALDELIEFVQLPARFEKRFHTRQLYGLVEHHVRQIYTGLFGWFDEDHANLFPMPPAERAARLIEGFGGRERVRSRAEQALADGDYRWAVELGSWLVRGSDDVVRENDAQLLARVLRAMAYDTPSANARNWCLTRALELEGTLDLGRFRVHRIRQREVEAGDARTFVEVLRVLLDPQRAGDMEDTLRWAFTDGTTVDLSLRGGVAVVNSGATPGSTITLDHAEWAALLSGKVSLADALAQERVKVEGDAGRVRRFLSAFEVPAFQAAEHGGG